MAKTGDYKVPFDQAGNQLHWADPNGNWPRDVVWEQNAPFEDVLTYKGYARGRSAAYLEFERQRGTTVGVFLSDFDKIAPLMVRGRIEGTFIFAKKGQNFGCKLA